MTKLSSSIPANNIKIIELYNKIKKGELDPTPEYQRKLVWKKQHKFNFIETILLNFPFPEIYLAPGEINTDTLSLKDEVVDGQQRCTTIYNYIEGKDVFASSTAKIKSFDSLEPQEKIDFLNYEVSVRYLKNANKVQIKDIFQRINSTDYSLNNTERINANWGDSEYVLFAKQIIEEQEKINYNIIDYKLEDTNRELLHNFFISEFSIFSENDINRMLALQYLLTLLTTLIEDQYFRRNDKVQEYIESYNENFENAGEIEHKLSQTVTFIKELDLDIKSYWHTKTNIFTLIVELSKYDLSSIDKDLLKNKLINFEADYKLYNSNPETFKEKTEGQINYYQYSREAVNEAQARSHRGKIVSQFITDSIS